MGAILELLAWTWRGQDFSPRRRGHPHTTCADSPLSRTKHTNVTPILQTPALLPPSALLLPMTWLRHLRSRPHSPTPMPQSPRHAHAPTPSIREQSQKAVSERVRHPLSQEAQPPGRLADALVGQQQIRLRHLAPHALLKLEPPLAQPLKVLLDVLL